MQQLSTVKVRRMEVFDLEAVLDIERTAFTMPWSRHSFRNLLGRSDADLWVAIIEGSVLGYAVVWYGGGDAELGNLAVAPVWRRQGLGRLLLDRVLKCARDRGSRRLFLEVRTSNRAAQALYAQRGFQPAGVRRRYYRAPAEDAVVMCLDFSTAAGAATWSVRPAPR
ncbi:MAG: ribosomal protein S18-alanine N-acetyltransferase [Gemmatimonadota bacterium]